MKCPNCGYGAPVIRGALGDNEERNSRHYHAYRHAVQGLLDAVPSDYPVPVGLGYALGVLREVHEEAEGEA
jgi:hypothetical protein